MKNLVRWEIKQSLESKAFLGFGITFIIGVLIFMCEMLFQEEISGYEVFLRNCNNLNSLFVLAIGIYAGIHIAGAFEERKVQAAVMAGNSRLSIVLSKLLSFSLVIAIFTVSSIGISSMIGFLFTKETGIDSFATMIVQGLVFMLVEVSFTSICFLISMLVKRLGTAIAVNFVTLLLLNGFAEFFLGKTWAEKFLKFTPAGQTFLAIGDTSIANMIAAIIASVFGVLLTVAVTYIIFRKEELK